MASLYLLCGLLLSTFVEGVSQTSCFSLIGTTLETLSGAVLQCSYMNSYYASCGAGPTSAIDSCICKQKVLNVLYECVYLTSGNREVNCSHLFDRCDNEMKSCLDTDDSGPHGVQEIISDWHVLCDNSISFKPTTPSTVVLSSTTYNSEACTAAESACNIGTSLGSSCVMDHPASAQPEQFSSCICRPQMLSAASVCQYDGNKTCFGVPAALNNIPQWSFCSVRITNGLLARC